jgi:diguanylate cyclase (GGDEF)-like protein
VDLLDVIAVSLVYYLGFLPVNLLIILYFFLIFLSVSEFTSGKTFFLTILSLGGFAINTVLLWPNHQILGTTFIPATYFYRFSVSVAVISLILAGIFTFFYTRSDRRLAHHLQQMLDEKEVILKETYVTHTNLEEKYAFFYTLTLIQQFLLEEMDENKLMTRITDIMQGVLGSYSCAIFTREKDNSYRLSAFSGKELPPSLMEIVKAEDSLVALAIKSQTIHNEKAISTNELNFWQQHGINSVITVPLSTKNCNLGVILAVSAQQFSFNREQQEQLMIIANQVSLALENTLLHKETQLMAWHDSLTGLYNRNYLDIFLSVLKDNNEKQIGCMIFDLDLFKVVNDTYGHITGDVVLQKFATILTSHTAPGRIAVRYGGEEFLMLALNYQTADLFNLAEQIRKELAAFTFRTNEGEEFSLTVSSGIAVSSGELSSFEQLFAQADAALYQAKNSGRNKVIIYGQH